MARRRSRRSTVRGKPNYLWINTAGELAIVSGNTVWDALLIPADWSGTVTETQCTLLRMVVSVYTVTAGAEAVVVPHAQNAAIVLGSASEGGGSDVNDISMFNEWPDFFQAYDRVLRIFRLEWTGEGPVAATSLPVQFSQLPEPVMNLKTPRRLLGDDAIRLCVGGRVAVDLSTPSVTWFARTLVRTGLR